MASSVRPTTILAAAIGGPFAGLVAQTGPDFLDSGRSLAAAPPAVQPLAPPPPAAPLPPPPTAEATVADATREAQRAAAEERARQRALRRRRPVSPAQPRLGTNTPLG